MSLIHSFEPVSTPSATRLILGSMPGKASLDAEQYYAHPRNLFWPIMGQLVGATPALSYTLRLEKLRSAGFALWDVLKSCRREGSLDSDIEESTVIPNDFQQFLLHHSGITKIFFNGTKAEQAFKKHVLPVLKQEHAVRINYQRLPSTSPANASQSYEQKMVAWQRILD